MRDPVIAALTNVSPSDSPQDLYQYVADKTTEYCQFHMDDNKYYSDFMDYWDDNIDRSVTKRSTMCDSYGLTFYGIQKYTRAEGHVDWVPKEHRGGAIVELARAIQAGLSSSLEGPNKGKKWLIEIAGIACENNKHLSWTTPSGFNVVHVYNKLGSRRSLAKMFNSKELQFFYRSKDIDDRSVKQAISPNYIHSLDAAHMFLVIFAVIHKGIRDLSMIHDSFGCHAPLIAELRKQTQKEFYKMHSENLLEKFRSDIQSKLGIQLPPAPVVGALNISDVLESEYFFS
jgi:DNA-directed RNA polymerase